MSRGRCSNPGCGRFARTGSPYCTRCEDAGDELADEASEAAAQLRARNEFRRRLESGEYRSLFGDQVNSVMRQAADVAGVEEEIGALRYTLAKLIAEEEDPHRLAKSVARIASVTVQAARARRLLAGQMADSLTDAVSRILEELDA